MAVTDSRSSSEAPAPCSAMHSAAEFGRHVWRNTGTVTPNQSRAPSATRGVVLGMETDQQALDDERSERAVPSISKGHSVRDVLNTNGPNLLTEHAPAGCPEPAARSPPLRHHRVL